MKISRRMVNEQRTGRHQLLCAEGHIADEIKAPVDVSKDDGPSQLTKSVKTRRGNAKYFHLSYSVSSLFSPAPSTAPLITSATSPSPMVIYVAWTPPPFTNGEILGYRIYLVSSAHTGLNWTTTGKSWCYFFF